MSTWFHEASTTTPLLANATFTSVAQPGVPYSAIVVAVKTDAAGVLNVELSVDGANWDSSLSYAVGAETNEVHRIVITRPYFRIRYVNGAVAQTYLRLSVMGDNYNLLTSPLNSNIQRDADAIVARSFGEELTIAEGKAEGYSVVTKFGRDPDVDTGTLPEDVWNGGGVYTGFPTGAAEEFQVLSTNAGDTGVLTFTYLPSFTATAWLQATVTLNGTTPVNTGITGVRMHTARYASGGATTFNLGNITVRHRTTTANVFCLMPIGTSQTYVSAYTVPFGYTGRIVRLFCLVDNATAGAVQGALWVRTLAGSPRLRRPFSAAQTNEFQERPYGGLTVNAGDDIIVRITAASVNNLSIVAGYDLILIKDD